MESQQLFLRAVRIDSSDIRLYKRRFAVHKKNGVVEAAAQDSLKVRSLLK